ncbi:pyridoxal phosphate-dependent aminotransferase family protein [bacterium]|nr:MAG: pyridoxal phosphate-dependent aminotransferase family protein [bacterium]
MFSNHFKRIIDLLNNRHLYPDINVITGASSSPEIEIKGKKYLTFCSNNYLGLANNKTINNVVKKAIKKYGIGSGGTRLLSGTLDVQVEFEEKLAEFYGYADAITFSSGFLANVGTIRMLIDSFPYFSIPFFNKRGV